MRSEMPQSMNLGVSWSAPIFFGVFECSEEMTCSPTSGESGGRQFRCGRTQLLFEESANDIDHGGGGLDDVNYH
jgi:hypothetical protein